MAVGKFDWPNVRPVSGFRLSGVHAGVRYKERLDLALIEICEGASVSGVFTKNAFCAEPVKVCKQHLGEATPRFLVVNSGNANACTGEPGWDAAIACCKKISELSGLPTNTVLPFSTGVIGEVLPAKKITDALPSAFEALTENGWRQAADAIMTTDTRPKGISKTLSLDGKTITVSGIAKGSGMIKPNMGTMLAYVATDAAVEQSVLDQWALIAANKSFNRITVDGDESTNDSLMIAATAKAGHETISSVDTEHAQALLSVVIDVCQSLAIEMVRDAEGATKCVKVDVRGGSSAQECLDVAYAICHSPLVKTACFASDPNWGRIVAAIGYAGIEQLDASKVKVWLDDVLIVEHGGRAVSYQEALGQAVFDKEEFSINVDLGRGDCQEALWTSDLSHDYVKINAEYRS